MYFLGYCSGLYPVINLVKIVIKLIQFAVPIALILFGSIDFAKAVIANKEDEMKKAQSIFIKRLIYAVAVFFVIVIVRLVMNVLASVSLTDAGGNELEVNNWRRCWDCESLDECKAITDIGDTYTQNDKIYYTNTDDTDPSKGIKCVGNNSGWYNTSEGKFRYKCTISEVSSTDNETATKYFDSKKDYTNSSKGIKCLYETTLKNYSCSITYSPNDFSNCDKYAVGEKDACRRGVVQKIGSGWWYESKSKTTYSGYSIGCEEQQDKYEVDSKKYFCFVK